MKIFTKAATSNVVSEREKQNSNIAYESACEAIVLLKNNATLPLKTKNVALYGSGIRKTVKGGTGSGEVNERHSISIYEAFVNQNYEITSNTWLDDYDKDYEKGLKEFTAKRKKTLLSFNVRHIISMMFALAVNTLPVLQNRTLPNGKTRLCYISTASQP